MIGQISRWFHSTPLHFPVKCTKHSSSSYCIMVGNGFASWSGMFLDCFIIIVIYMVIYLSFWWRTHHDAIFNVVLEVIEIRQVAGKAYVINKWHNKEGWAQSSLSPWITLYLGNCSRSCCHWHQNWNHQACDSSQACCVSL